MSESTSGAPVGASSELDLPCASCGCRPAAQLKLESVTVWGLFWIATKMNEPMCRDCGVSRYNDMQTRNLTRGWWSITGVGFIGILLMLLSKLPGNRRRIQKHKALGVPEAKDPYAYSPVAAPLPSNSPALQRANVKALIVLGIFLQCLFWLFAAAIAATAYTTAVPLNIGSCLGVSTDGQEKPIKASCTGSNAKYVVVSTVDAPNQCPDVQSGSGRGLYVARDDGLYACLVAL